MDVQSMAREDKRSVIADRYAATIVDGFVFVAALWLIFVLPEDAWVDAALAWVAGIPLYYVLAEGLAGRTVGKRVLRLRVVDARGRAPGLGRALVRTITRVLEVNPGVLGGVPAGIIALCSADGQRLGDMLARTYVVREEALLREEAMLDGDPDLACCGSCGAPFRWSDYRDDLDVVGCSRCRAELRRPPA